MFQRLQQFMIASVLVVLLLAAGGGWYLRTASVDFVSRIISEDNQKISQGYIVNVWNKYRAVIVPIAADANALRNNPQVPLFAQDTVRYFQFSPLLRVNIYSAAGGLLISDNVVIPSKLAGSGASPNKDFVAAYLKGDSERSSQVVHDVALQGNERGEILQILFPLRGTVGDNPPIDGAIEVLFDVTKLMGTLRLASIIIPVIFASIFAIFFGVVSINFRKAESAIAKQDEVASELRQTVEDAVAQSQEKSNFLTNISHELRTPLNAIIGFSDIIKTELLPQLTERKYDQYVNDINAAGVHLLSLINDILDYSKAEAGKLVVEVAEIDITKMIQNCVRLVSPRAEAGEVKLVDEMPKAHIIMVLDNKKFKQIMLNLLSNAVKFTPAGGNVSVTAWVNLTDDTITFVVSDSGIGIAAKDISRAMSPFGQVDNTLKRKYEGTGLGLPLTKKFVELMGGHFNIESEIGKGTKVIFTLPREVTERDGVIVKRV